MKVLRIFVRGIKKLIHESRTLNSYSAIILVFKKTLFKNYETNSPSTIVLLHISHIHKPNA